MRKKAQGMPMNLIIIAAILLIVLVVILFIFTGRAKDFTKGVESCEAKGGECVYEGHNNYPCEGPSVFGTDCKERFPYEEKVKCCITI